MYSQKRACALMLCLLLSILFVVTHHVYGTGSYKSSVMGGMNSVSNTMTISNYYAIVGEAFYLDTTARVIYFSEQSAYIRKITLSTGVISTVAGTGTIGITYTSSPATTQVYAPKSITKWKTNNLIWIDGDYKIRKLDLTTNQISLIFGAGYGNSDNTVTNPLSVLSSSSPSITTDPSDNIYWADYANYLIRKIDSTGTVASVYMTGLPSFVSQIKYCNGGLYVYTSDNGMFRILKLTESGGTVTSTTVVGGGASKSFGISGTSFQLDGSNVVRKFECYNNELYWISSDYYIVKLTTSNIVQQVFGNGKRGESPDGTVTTSSIMGYSSCISFDTDGTLFFSENTFNMRKLLGSTLSTLSHYRNSLSERDPKTTRLVPTAIATTSDGTGMYVAEYYTVKYYNFTSSTIKHVAGYMYLPYDPTTSPTGADNIGASYETARYVSITSMACADNGDIYLVDVYPGSVSYIKLLSKSTGFVTFLAGSSSGSVCANGNTPTTCTITNAKNLHFYNNELYFATDNYIYKISSSTGKIVVVLGGGGSTADGASSTASISTLKAFFIRPSDGKIYYLQLDGTTYYLKVFTASTVTTRFSGSSNFDISDFVVNDNGDVYYTAPTELKLFTPTTVNGNSGTSVSYAGNAAGTYNDGETLANTKFNSLRGLKFISQSNYLIVAEWNELRKIYMNCDANYGGAYCTLPYCNSIRSDSASVCNSHGTCTAVNTCSCSTGYSGTYCTSWACSGYSNGVTTGCSDHGTCSAYNTCTCSSNYYGSNCSVTTCNGVYSNSSQVCSGKGTCSGYNTCSCSSNYYGTNCENFNCYSVAKTDTTNVCSGHGTCTDYNTCACSSNYFGSYCNITSCYGVLQNSSLTCSSHGTCNSLDNCQCNSNYFGLQCQYPYCYGIMSNDSTVCSGHGSCSGVDTCSCSANYYGSYCNITSCYGVLQNSSLTCNSQGTCVSLDNCQCSSNYFGSQCQYTYCYGLMSNDTQVCSGHGVCSSADSCTCSSNYYGSDCSITSCYGVLQNSSLACNSHGTCNSLDNCQCNANYYGLQCQYPYCYGIMSNDSTVCSSHGTCSSVDTCSCSTNYYGNICNITSCYGVLQNSSSTCSSHGTCIGLDNCQCSSNYGGTQCQYTTCFGTLSNETVVCSGHGSCSNVDTCTCSSNYEGTQCELLKCNGTSKDDPSVCSSNGFCVNGVCQCNSTYGGDFCSLPKCFNILSNETTVCSSHGQCISPDTCTCDQNWMGSNCSTAKCYGKAPINACSHHGTCTQLDQCTCDAGYYGNECDFTTCFGIHFNSSEVCSGFGSCISLDNCNCMTGHLGANCSLNAPSAIISERYECFGISSIEDMVVCSGNGECIGNNDCKCANGFFGDRCNITSCNGKRQDDSSVCSGKGKCSIDGKCICQPGYGGQDCQVKTCFGIPSTSSQVCSGRGNCSDINTCECYSISGSNVKIIGDACENLLCKGVYNGLEDYYSNNDYRVCSNRGKCSIDPISLTGGCTCQSGYYGDKCELFNCNSIAKNDSSVCSGHGQCIGIDICKCSFDTNGYYYGPTCNSCHPSYTGGSCNVKACTGSTCMNGGSCGVDNNCNCIGNFTGIICEACNENIYGPGCNIYCNSQTTCNGHGRCDNDGMCSCFSDKLNGYWNGTSCDSCKDGYYGDDCLTYFGSFNSSQGDQIYAQINENFDGINFKVFAPPINTSNSVQCSKLIHEDDSSLFGTEPKCLWTDKANGYFKIQFDYDFNLNYTSTSASFRVNRNVFSKSTAQSFIRLYLTISQSINIPIANVKSSKKIYSISEDLIFYGSDSYSGDRKELDYSWSLEGSVIPSNVSSIIQNNKKSKLKIEKGSLAIGIYKLGLVVKSKVTNEVSSSESFSFQVQEIEVPAIVILGNVQTICKSTAKFVHVKKITFVPDYLKSGISVRKIKRSVPAVTIDWEQLEGPKIDFSQDSYSNLVIEKFLAGKWRYVFRSTIAITQNDTLSSSDYVVISTEQPELSLSLSLKSVSNSSSTIQVNYQDPENNSDETELWQWSCINSETEGYCGDVVVQKMSISSKNRSPLLSIDQIDYSRTLEKATFTLTVTKGERKVSSSLTLNVLHAPPIINIMDISPHSKSVVNSNDKVSMEVLHSKQDDSDSSLSVKTEWKLDSTVVSESLTTRVDYTSTFITSEIISSNSKDVTVVNKNERSAIIVDAKSLEEDSEHSIELKVAYVKKNESKIVNGKPDEIEIASTESKKTFKKAKKPSKCPCNISPLSGVSMQTEFTIECENCQNEQNSIEITQGYVDVERGVKVPIPLQEENRVKIPAIGVSSSNVAHDESVQWFVELTDRESGESRVMYSNITVTTVVVNTVTEILEIVANQTTSISKVITDGDSLQSISQTVNTIVSTNQMIQSLPIVQQQDTTTITQLQSNLLETLTRAVETTTQETITETTTSMIVYGVYSIVKSEQVVAPVVIDKSVTILNNIVEQSTTSNLEVSTETTQTFMSVIENLSKSVEVISSSQEQVNFYQELTNVTESLAYSIVKEQTVSEEPVVLQTSTSSVMVDKVYYTDLASSVISSITTQMESVENTTVNVSLPSITTTDANGYVEITYSIIVEKYTSTIEEQILTNASSTWTVVSPVCTTFSILDTSNVSITNELSNQNITIQMFVESNDTELEFSVYSCVGVNTDLTLEAYNCTADYDVVTSSVKCNCQFRQLEVSNLVIIRNVTKTITIEEELEIYTCFGISSIEDLVICSGNGECIGNDKCKCSSGFFGERCNVTSCNGKRQDDVTVCSGKGKCFEDGHCQCVYGYGGKDCEAKTCYGKLSTDPSVCSGRGVCTAVDTCTCFALNGTNVKITGATCENLLCRGIYNGVEDYFATTDYRACSNHGKCVINATSMVGECKCNSGYYGEKCDIYKCYNIASNETNVCSGHGSCTGINSCSCNYDGTNGYYSGSQCSSCHTAYSGVKCLTRYCNNSTCLHGGICSNNICNCVGNFTGLLCENCKPNLFGSNCDIYCNPKTNCNSHGSCASTGKCSCYADTTNGYWNGTSCDSCKASYYGVKCATYIGSYNSTTVNNIYAQVSQYFDAITFQMIPPSTYTSNTVTCSKLIHAVDFSLFGTEPKCFWTDKTNGIFTIQFDYDFDFDVTSGSNTFRLNSNVFTTTTTATTINYYIPIYFILSKTIIPPVAKVKSTKKVYSTTEDLGFSGTNSYSGDKKELDYNWDIQGNNIPAIVKNKVQANKLPSIKIDKGYLSAGVYKVLLVVKSTVTNEVSGRETFTFQIQGYEIPSISVSGNKETIYKSTEKNVLVKKTTSIPANLQSQSITINWEQLEGPSLSFKKDTYNNLIIEKFLAGKWRYVFRSTIMSAQNTTLSSSDYVVISTEQPELSLSLSLKSVSNSSTIQVNYQDPENNSDETELWQWICVNSETEGYCGDVITDKLIFHSKNHSTIVTAVYNDFSIQTIRKPKWTLLITKGERSVNSSITMNIVYSPPIVNIIDISPSTKTIVNSNDKISIEVQKSQDSTLSVITQWTLDSNVVSESETSKVTPSSPITTTTTIAPTLSNIQTINKNEQSAIIIDAKGLDEGIEHSVGITVSYVQKNESNLIDGIPEVIEIASTESSKSFTKATQPKKCPCTVLPATGVSMQTDFTLSCENCQNELNTIEITQGYIDTETNTKIIVPLDEDNKMKLPALIPSSSTSSLSQERNETITLFVELTDIQTGESRIMLSNITVSTVVASSITEIVQQVENQTNAIISNFNKDGDSSLGISQTVNTIVSSTQMIQSLPQAQQSSALVTNIQTTLLNTLESVTETTSETITESTSSAIVYAVQKITSTEQTLSATVIDKSISILENTVEQVTKNQVELTTETTQNIITIVDTLNTNIENIAVKKDQFTEFEKVSTLTENVATSIVNQRTVSADPVIIQTETSTVVVDKVYLTDFTNSTISISESSSSSISVNVSIPVVKVNSESQFSEITYAMTIEENTAVLMDSVVSSTVSTTVQYQKSTVTTTNTVEVVSSISTSFEIVENSTTVSEQVITDLSSKNISIDIPVESGSVSSSSETNSTYSCVSVESDMSLNKYQCSASFDESTSIVTCNCQFTELVVNNLIVINNTTTVAENLLLTFTCFGISSLENKVVCSGNGECIGNNDCKCVNGFFGERCNITSCNGKRQDDSSVCSGKGKCSIDGKCICQSGYGGQDCQEKTCFGIPSTSSQVCSGRGACVDIDKCSCLAINGVKITGDSCENLLCQGVINGVEEYYSNNDYRVCSTHGKCLANTTSLIGGCKCDPGYYGDKCDQFDCYSIPRTSSSVCSGHGQCLDANTCKCLNDDTNGHYYSSECNTCHPAFSGPKCTERSCTGSTCLNGGSCGSNNTCVCTGGFDGLICETCKTNLYGSNCDIYCNSQTTCNGNGQCDNTGKCTCYQDRDHGYWNGTSCDSCMSGYFGSDCATFFGSFNSSLVDQIYAQINENFDGINFKLFAPPSYTSNSIPCSKLIHPDDLPLLGTEPKCYWTDKASGDFKIQFDYDFTLNSASIVRLNRFSFSKITTTTTIIEYYIRIYILISQTIKPPIAQVTSSKKIFSYYEDIIFSGSNSYSGDKKELEYIWDLQGDSISSTVLNTIRANKKSSMTIQKGSLVKGLYTLILKVKSQVTNQISSSQTIIFQVQEVEMASVLISGEKQSTFKSTDQFVSIKKVTYIPTNLKDLAINVEWEQIEGPIVKYHKDSYQNLIIEKFATGKVKYVFKVTISVVNQTSTTISDFALINTYQPDLSLSLSLKETSIVKNVIQVYSLDPENNLDEKEIWKWSCINSETNGYCGDGILEKMSQYSKNHSSLVVFNQNDFSLLTLTKPKLTLSITKGERQAYSSLILNIVHSPPIVTIINVEPASKSIINSNDKISIEVQHSNQDLTDSSVAVKTQWKLDTSLVSESITSKTSSSNTLTTTTTVSPTSGNIQVVNRNEQTAIMVAAKELEEGVQHSIQLKVAYVQKNESSEIEIASTESSKSFTKAAQPKKCPCIISPQTGISMQTDFTFTCQNCQNEQNSIRINQGYIDVGTGIMIYVPLTQEKTMKLPATGSSASSNSTLVHLFVELTDTQTGEFRVMYFNVTVTSVVVTSITQVIQQVTSQSSTIMSSFVRDGDSSQSISQTINTIVASTQMLQTLPESEKSSASIQTIQTTLLDTLANATETAAEETISESTSSMIVYAIHSMLKNEQNIGQVVIEKSVSALENLVENAFKSKVDLSLIKTGGSSTTQTFMSVVENLNNNIANITNLRDQFAKAEEISALTEKLALSIVKSQTTSADPVVLNSGVSIVKADKKYAGDISKSVISSPTTTEGVYKAVVVNVDVPDILVAASNPFSDVTYSMVVKENIPIIVQKLINEQDVNSTLQVVSPVSTSFSMSKSNSTAVDLSQNVTFHIRVSNDNYAITDLSSYSCVRVESDLGNDLSSCTVSGCDNATSTIDCNCVFTDLFISNVIVVKNSSSIRTYQASNKTFLTTQDIIIISTIIGGTCFILIVVFCILVVAGVIYRRGCTCCSFCACCCCKKQRRDRAIHDETELRAQMVIYPSKTSELSASTQSSSARTTTTHSQSSVSVRMAF